MAGFGVSPSSPQPDFLRPMQGPSALAWAWCGTGMLVLAAAGLDARAAWLDRQQAQQRLAAAQQRVDAPRAVMALAGSTSAADGPGSRQAPATRPSTAVPPAELRQAEARRWLQRLAHPWPAVWAASEGASASGIAWLGFDHDGRTSLRLNGLAPDAGLPHEAAQALRAQGDGGGAVWRTVVLSRLERVPEGQRFEITAQLATAAEAPR